MGFLERETGRAHAFVAKNTKAVTLHGQVTDNVEPGSTIYSDQLASYRNLRYEYVHEVVDHINEYVRGDVHTNGLDALRSRGLGLFLLGLRRRISAFRIASLEKGSACVYRH